MAVFIGRSGHRLGLLGPLGDAPRQRHAPEAERTGNIWQHMATWQAFRLFFISVILGNMLMDAVNQHPPQITETETLSEKH